MRRWIAGLAAIVLAVPALAAGEPGWDLKTDRVVDGPEARIVIRTGDIDNLGYGWPAKFTPFSGHSTPSHGFPWKPDPTDPAGTDRIMVSSAFDPNASPRCRTGSDGYTGTTQRADNQPQAVELELGELGAPKAVLIQMFVDDFQAERHQSKFTVTLNGEPLQLFEQILNKVDQTGPIGKLVSIKLFPEQMHLLQGEKAVFLIDETTGACDGYALDFVRILIDPKPAAFPVTLEGDAVDIETREPIPGAIVQAALGDGTTGADGTFRIEGLPAGLVTAQASHPDFESDVEIADLEVGETGQVHFEMKRRKVEAASLGESLDEQGRVVIPGIYFDTAKATLRPDSEPALKVVLTLMTERPETRFVVEGHTDSQGDDDYNLGLSRDRAASVVAWLVANGIDTARLTPDGFGESRPVADNESETGRQLNRRVEVVIAK